MSHRSLMIAFFTMLFGIPGAGQVGSQSLKITYLYDNTTISDHMKPDWGFSCLVEEYGKDVLFDAGANPDILRANIAALHVDVSRISAVVFSHEHRDHTGGVEALGNRPGLPVFFPAAFGKATRAAFLRQGFLLMPVSTATEVLPGFATSDELGAQIREEALVAEIPEGLVVIAGCAHPGIIPMLKQIAASRKRPLHMVLGGFHLLQTPADEVRRIVAEFKALGVDYVGPTHCTGDAAIRLFQTAYGSHFITGGVGTVVRAPMQSSR
jgi:7,8-dihydropterin-6-yl-methyl-4-(beta-D-ribofuranosyl)aminobenzene 5'-phosphate synthase